MPKLTVAKVALLGGLQDSKAIPEPTDLQELENMVSLRGRFALRAPAVETCQFVAKVSAGSGLARFTAANGTTLSAYTSDSGFGAWDDTSQRGWGVPGAWVQGNKLVFVNSQSYDQNVGITCKTPLTSDSFTYYADFKPIGVNSRCGLRLRSDLGVTTFSDPGNFIVVNLVPTSETNVAITCERRETYTKVEGGDIATGLNLGALFTDGIRLGATVEGSDVIVWTEPYGGGTRTIRGTQTFVVADFNDDDHVYLGLYRSYTSGDTGTTVDTLTLESTFVSQVLAAKYHLGFMYVVAWSEVLGETYLYKLNTDGTPISPATSPIAPIATVWDDSVLCPVPILCSFQGGSDTTNVDRLYITDYNGNEPTVYWNDTEIVPEVINFNDAALGTALVYVPGLKRSVAHPEKFRTTKTIQYSIADVLYTKAPTDSLVFSAADTINNAVAAGVHYGIWCLQIDSAGAISTKPPTADQAYTDSATAIAALPAADSGKVRIGSLLITAKTGTKWTANTDDLKNASDVTTALFADSSPITEGRVFFRLIFAYQSHLWGTAFFQSGADARPEIARFSRPGLIAEAEPGATYNAVREWWSTDWRPFGTRGLGFTAIGYAGGNAVLYKTNEAHALFGYDSDSWQTKVISSKVGAVGPNANAGSEAGMDFFWSTRGPMVTDGNTVKDIGEDVRRRVQEIVHNDNVTVQYSTDDGLVYFGVPAAIYFDGSVGSGWPDVYIAYDTGTNRWVKGAFRRTSDGKPLQFSALASVPNVTTPTAPTAPNTLVATAISDIEVDLTWVNGDTSLETKTEVYRSATSSFTPSSANYIGTVNSGIVSYKDTTCPLGRTTYYYQLRHLKSLQYSYASNEANAKTAMTRPSGLTATTIPGGVRLDLTNNQPGINSDMVLNREHGTDTIEWTFPTQPQGAVTLNDMTGTAGTVYRYRARARYSGEMDSPYTAYASAAAGWPVVAFVPASATQSVGLAASCPSTPNVTLVWSTTGGMALDTVQVWQVLFGAHLHIATLWRNANGGTVYFKYKSGAYSTPLHYELKLIDGGGSQQDSIDTVDDTVLIDVSNPCS